MPTVNNSIQVISERGAPRAASRPRLLYVASSPSQGGIERYSVRMAARFAARGFFLQFACRPESFIDGQCRERGLPPLPLLVRNSGDLGAAQRLARQIVENEIDLVHVHSRRDYVIGVLAVALAKRRSRRERPPRLLLHAHMIRPLGTPAGLSGRFFARGAAGVIAVSDAVQRFLCTAHGFSPSFVSRIHNGVEIDDFAVPPSAQAREWRRALRREWHIAPDAPVIGMVGRLDAKGQAALLRVVPSLILAAPALQVVLVGGEGLPGEQQRLQALADTHGFADRLVFTGERDDIPAALAAFDILVHLPLDESFGLALAEAMASGLPTVATNIGGCREVLREGVSGLLVAPGDPAALQTALLALLDTHSGPALRSQMGRAGRQIAEAEFSLDRQIDHLENLYRAVCASSV